MPYQRPSLPTIIQQTQANIASRLPGTNPLLPFSTLQILSYVFSGNLYSMYSYLDYISKQAVPVTSTDESLLAWAALKGLTLKPATPASGQVQFTGISGSLVPTGTVLVRPDGVLYAVDLGGTLVDGIFEPSVTATTTGLITNLQMTDVLTTFGLQLPISGVNTTVTMISDFTGGSDVEGQDSLRSRMIEAFSNPIQGGAVQDYVTWALQVPGITRAWAAGPEIMGAGTCTVYTMLDNAQLEFYGIPQGTNGGSQFESRITPATGDQLAVADHLYPLRAATALVWSMAPVPVPLDIVIAEVPPDTTIQQGIVDAVAAFCIREATPGGVTLPDLTTGGTIRISHLYSAIASVPGLDYFDLQSPTDDVILPNGHISVPPATIVYV